MTAATWCVRAMRAADIAAILAIQNESPETARWSAADYQQACSTGWYAAVAEGERSVAGFLVARASADELEILNMAVRPAERRCGAGSCLVAEALGFGLHSGAKTVFLEVRESNSAAIAFYQRHGFNAKGRRRRYYSDPTQDALILSRALP